MGHGSGGVLYSPKPTDHDAVSMITLSNIFTRERSLFYAFMWNDSDRMGYSRWLAHDVRHNAFVFDPMTGKLQVFYDENELAEINAKLAELLFDHPEAFNGMTATLDANIDGILPFVTGEKTVQSTADVAKYFNHLITWWSAMNLLFMIPDLTDLPESIRNEALARRIVGEKFSDQFESVFINFWKMQYPEFADLARVVSPAEAFAIGTEGPSDDLIATLRDRLQTGCALFDQAIYRNHEWIDAMRVVDVGFSMAVTTEIHELVGRVACPGKATGKVRIILLKKDVGLIEEGEILVSTMTTPDFVPAVKKCAAIITDEGGITCHAAIVSRELGKPCIIGTKIATKVLKEGDVVEVDAEKGIVRIIDCA